MGEAAKKVVGYVRVSVDNENKVSPEMQADAIVKFCDLREWELVETIIERGRSAGEGKKRPEFDRARKMIRTGAADTLMVWKIDRCSRSVRDFADVVSELRRHDADFVSVTENFDTSSAIGRAMLQVTMVFAELERERSSERVTAWHRWKSAQGADPTSMPLGYYRERDETGKQIGPILVDENTAPVVKQAVDILLATNSTTEVQRFLGEAGYPKYSTSVRHLLRSPTLAGIRVLDDGTRVPGDWPAIIDLDTHKAVLANLDSRKRKRGRPKNPRQLLTSIAVCGRCGKPMMMGQPHRGHRARYQCSTSVQKYSGPGPHCTLSIFQDHLERHVEQQVLQVVTPEVWERMRTGRRRVDAPTIDPVALEADLTQLAEDWAHSTITRAEWDAARKVLLERINETEEEVAASSDDDLELPDVADLHKAWTTGKLSLEAKRLVISAVVDRIVVNPGFLIPGRRNGWAPVEDRVVIHWR